MPNVIVGVSKDYAGTFDEALSEVKSWGLPVSSTLPELGVIVAAVEPHREQEILAKNVPGLAVSPEMYSSPAGPTTD